MSNQAVVVAAPTLPVLSDQLKTMVANNDYNRLGPKDKEQLIWSICGSLGLNPLTQPLQFIQMKGKTVLYATKDAANQLKNLHGVSVDVEVSPVDKDGLIMVHARAKLPCGRYDEDYGGAKVSGLKGDDLLNAKLKAVTKAKRRVTLSICGLGFLDETEVRSVVGDKHMPKVDPQVISDEEERQANIRLAKDLIKAIGYRYAERPLGLDDKTLRQIFDDETREEWDQIKIPKEKPEHIQLKVFTQLIAGVDWNSDMSEDPRVREKFNADLKVLEYFRRNALSNDIEILYNSASS